MIEYNEMELAMIIAESVLSRYGLSIWGYCDKIEIVNKSKFVKILKQSIDEWGDEFLKEDVE